MHILCKIKLHKWKYSRFLNTFCCNFGYNRWVRICQKCGKEEIEFFRPIDNRHYWGSIMKTITYNMIKTKDRLPDPTPVLVLCDEIFDYDIGIYHDSKWSTRTFGERFNVVYWQLLPLIPGDILNKISHNKHMHGIVDKAGSP